MSIEELLVEVDRVCKGKVRGSAERFRAVKAVLDRKIEDIREEANEMRKELSQQKKKENQLMNKQQSETTEAYEKEIAKLRKQIETLEDKEREDKNENRALKQKQKDLEYALSEADNNSYSPTAQQAIRKIDEAIQSIQQLTTDDNRFQIETEINKIRSQVSYLMERYEEAEDDRTKCREDCLQRKKEMEALEDVEEMGKRLENELVRKLDAKIGQQGVVLKSMQKELESLKKMSRSQPAQLARGRSTQGRDETSYAQVLTQRLPPKPALFI